MEHPICKCSAPNTVSQSNKNTWCFGTIKAQEGEREVQHPRLPHNRADKTHADYMDYMDYMDYTCMATT